MGNIPSQPPAPPSPPALPQSSSSAPNWFQSYFLPAILPSSSPSQRNSPAKHRHRRPGPHAIHLVSLLLVQKGLPLDLAHRILDEARYWAICTRECDAAVDVEARRGAPRYGGQVGGGEEVELSNGTRNGAGERWVNGQEEEMRWEMELGMRMRLRREMRLQRQRLVLGQAGEGATQSGTSDMDETEAEGWLRDEAGKTWVLVSGKVGCMSRRPENLQDPPDWFRQALDTGQEGDGGMMRNNQATVSLAAHTMSTLGDQQLETSLDSPRRSAWLRRVVVDMFSRDQGWTDDMASYGTYNNSFSWFELSLLRDGREVRGSRRSIQNNVHAGQYFKPHRVVLEENDELVKMAQEGDRIVLWARAEFPGWRNVVRSGRGERTDDQRDGHNAVVDALSAALIAALAQCTPM